jgi:hypothetical protein
MSANAMDGAAEGFLRAREAVRAFSAGARPCGVRRPAQVVRGPLIPGGLTDYARRLIGEVAEPAAMNRIEDWFPRWRHRR